MQDDIIPYHISSRNRLKASSAAEILRVVAHDAIDGTVPFTLQTKAYSVQRCGISTITIHHQVHQLKRYCHYVGNKPTLRLSFVSKLMGRYSASESPRIRGQLSKFIVCVIIELKTPWVSKRNNFQVLTLYCFLSCTQCLVNQFYSALFSD